MNINYQENEQILYADITNNHREISFFKLKYIFIDGFLNGLYFKKQPRKLITNNKYDNKIISLMINILEVFFCLKLHRFI